MHLYSVRAIAGELYIAGEQGVLLKLDRASSRFVALTLPYKGTLFGVTGNSRAVVVHGLRGNVLRSTDAGASWQAVPTGLQVGMTASAAGADGSILLASQAGHLLSSRDDGATFVPLTTERPFPAAAVRSRESSCGACFAPFAFFSAVTARADGSPPSRESTRPAPRSAPR